MGGGATKFLLYALSLMAAAAVAVLFIFDISPLPGLLTGGNPRPFANGTPRTGPVASIDDYRVLQQGFLLESNTSAYLAVKRAPLLGGDTAYLVRCQGAACTRQKILQAEHIDQGVANGKFDQFVFLTGRGPTLHYVNTEDNVVSYGALTVQCSARPDEPKPSYALKSVGVRTAYLRVTGQDCLRARFNKLQYELTQAELGQPTTDELKLQFAPNGALASLELEYGMAADGRRLK